MIRPEEAGLDASRLTRMDAMLRERYLDTGKLIGFSTLVARRGGVAHFTAHGNADQARNKPFAEDSLLRIYSMTKPVTSVALMMLVEDGRIALDHPVHRYIPSWEKLGVYDGGIAGMFRSRPPKRPMQIVDLLRHTSGLSYGFQYRTNVDAAYRAAGVGEIDKKGSLDDMIQQLSSLPLEFDPGSCWNYSVSTDVLGYIVAKVAGMPFEDFLRTRIFSPLGMDETDFFVKPGLQGRFAACYFSTPGKPPILQDDPETSRFLEPPAFISGGGGLVSTSADYLKFCEMILNGGRRGDVRLLSPKTIDLMGANHLPGGKDLTELSVSLFSEATYSGVGFGLGFSTTIDSAATLLPGSNGDLSWGGAASTYFWIDPKEQLIAIFMTQLMPSTAHPIRRDLRTLVYSAFTD
jgi:CubicO group peptidase (beta-lactamase class C family)